MKLKIQQNKIVQKTERFIQIHFEGESSGHDWWHIFRVRNLAMHIAEKEGGDLFLVEMAALLHDLDDWKLNEDTTFSNVETWLKGNKVEKAVLQKIIEIIEQVSFKGALVENHAKTIEARIVQDADRLDALGAIGIARTFAYGGSKGRLIYHPEIKPVLHDSFKEYQKTSAPTINHFYEKLLLLKDRLNTETAKKIARDRHSYMENFLEQFYAEWNGNF